MALVTRHSPPNLFLASANPGKLREFQAAAEPLGISFKVLPRFCQLTPSVEDGVTFEENARKKALHYSGFTDERVFADDSGICVDALNGEPGIYSARYAGPRASDAENNAKLLAELTNVPAEKRAAHYLCVIALAERGKILAVLEGRADGIILTEPRGPGGFGYDPLFFFPPLGKTFAELAPEEKFAASHRGEAFRKLLAFLGRT